MDSASVRGFASRRSWPESRIRSQARFQVPAPAVHVGGDLRRALRFAADQLGGQRADRAAPVRLGAVVGERRRRASRSQSSQVSSASRKGRWASSTRSAWKRRDRADQLALAAREVVEELALAGRRSGADVVEARAADAAREDEVGRRLDDPGAGRGALRGELAVAASRQGSAFWTARSSIC